MRLHRLEFQAIGSYPGAVEVDFDLLGPSGLFHIHGPTGSGKSSILDAMCFALFGTVPSPRRADGLRSHHADPSTEARASVEFSIDDSHWRVLRSPTQLRAKARGEGTTEQRTTVTLLRRAGSNWKPVASGAREVDPMIRELIGLDADQFMQVVVLPQGAFERALRAGGEERAALLSTLFDTQRFRWYGEQLKTRAEVLHRELVVACSGIRGLADRARERAQELGIAFDVALEDDIYDLGSDVSSRLVLAELRDRARLISEDGDRRLSELREKFDEMSEKTRSMAVTADLSARKATAREQLTQLRASEPEIESLRLQLSKAKAVTALVERLRHLDSLDDDVKKAENERSDLLRRLRLESNGLPPMANDLTETITALGDGEGLAEITSLRSICQSILVKLESSIEIYDEAGRLRSMIESYSAESVQLEHEIELEDDNEVLLSTRTVSVVTELSASQKSAATIDTLRSTVDRLISEIDGARALHHLKERHSELQVEFDEARRTALDARSRHLDLVERRLENIASELAGSLQPGQPCAVCGSDEHPRPAAPAADAIDARDVSEAEARAIEAQHLADQLQDSIQRLSCEIESATGIAGRASVDLAAVETERVDAERRLEEALAASVVGVELEATIADLDQKLTICRHRKIELHSTLANARSLLEQSRSRLSENEVELQRTLGCSRDLEGSLEKMESVAESIDRLVDVLAFVKRQRNQLGSARDELTELLDCSPVDTIEQLRALSTTVDRLTEIENRVNDFDNSTAKARSILDELADVIDVDMVQLRLQEHQLHETRLALEHAVAEETRVTAEARHLADQVERLLAKLDEVQPLREETERVVRLAELCRGTGVNSKRISLERYVLAAFLEEVAVAASRRLHVMTSGRYGLRHSDSRIRGNAASGLALLVSDTHTGVDREVSTLSGGETFLASLAFALGLADVVQHHAGGVRIEALFVDEGFGSLDSDALDLAISELDRLREGGRTVGVISHVPALCQRIPTGIEVVATPSGSHIRVGGLATRTRRSPPGSDTCDDDCRESVG